MIQKVSPDNISKDYCIIRIHEDMHRCSSDMFAPARMVMGYIIVGMDKDSFAAVIGENEILGDIFREENRNMFVYRKEIE